MRLLRSALAAGSLALLITAPVNAGAETTTINDQFEITGAWGSDCFGEVVNIEGTLHIVVRYTTLPDGSATANSVVNPQGVSGTGETTGNLYHEVGPGSFAFASVSTGAFVVTATDITRIQSTAGGPTLAIHGTFRLVFDSTGQLRVEFMDFDEGECV